MRLWSLHPQYLDPQGLVALWRESLLAQSVLRGETRGYRNHPQLERFRAHRASLSAISFYLTAIHAEAERRGYAFDETKIRGTRKPVTLSVTTGQVDHEWSHLLNKLNARSPDLHARWRDITLPLLHPIFSLRQGDVEPWERNTVWRAI